ncbi:hypothetical protein DBA29_20495 [Xenophilus aerolatus]|nr:hypothetical protein [Xenophilus aerolatus]
MAPLLSSTSSRPAQPMASERAKPRIAPSLPAGLPTVGAAGAAGKPLPRGGDGGAWSPMPTSIWCSCDCGALTCRSDRAVSCST